MLSTAHEGRKRRKQIQSFAPHGPHLGKLGKWAIQCTHLEVSQLTRLLLCTPQKAEKGYGRLQPEINCAVRKAGADKFEIRYNLLSKQSSRL